MDTSETYIKMCDCPEIQDKFKAFDCSDLPVFAYDTRIGCAGILFWTPATLTKKLGQLGNTLWVSVESHNDRGIYLSESEGKFSDEKIWLPRQDQLQEMIVAIDTIPRKLVKALWDWIAQTAPPSNYSMEQLWLAFVMKENHNKTWDGEKWIT